MSIYNQFATDKHAEIEGVWVEYGRNEDGSIPAFKISRMSKANKKYTKSLDLETRPHRRSIELEIMDNDLAEQVFMKVFVSTILLDWKNIKQKNGENLDFSQNNALRLFEDLPELYEDLQEKAKKASLFREEKLAEEAGN